MREPAQAGLLVDWDLVKKTLGHLKNLLNDTDTLKEKYGFVMTEEVVASKPITNKSGDEGEVASTSRFKKLFSQSDSLPSTAMARVLQSKNSTVRKIRWAAFDKANMKLLLDDISYFVERLHDSLNVSVQVDLHNSMQMLLHQATSRYSNLPDLECLRQIVADMQKTRAIDTKVAETLVDDINAKRKNMFFYAINHDNIAEVENLLSEGVGTDADDFCG